MTYVDVTKRARGVDEIGYLAPATASVVTLITCLKQHYSLIDWSLLTTLTLISLTAVATFLVYAFCIKNMYWEKWRVGIAALVLIPGTAILPLLTAEKLLNWPVAQDTTAIGFASLWLSASLMTHAYIFDINRGSR